ncbi:MAG: GIY-YIG nuclease family protein [Hyphomonas sp.]|uniref:GIY-YIG nuclease family protein n=1 Tax=Hyphomonas sp. TaxID=87 RepID=UPI00183BD3C9|nr:GIY-YIG nuclease family protein [Hyphomonas sp.]MBU3921893.1 GIY-YIG nuclease family protein [Alphaproteobacteria bacterium]MBA3069591.1 GIY-YIG nuclease family protein [Hyphomonas sp.]MBU4063248.1 GIY-YIG nuclease family protein [Alphaproteobacteria bacterium]MBU4164066.1 GIY-YIG nuclease family protein [Alphaproteobacteria bacterium]MBU4569295.1 GIY-YIG nuclease family protein [Alphaproteobacteria bacterium]
MFLFDWFIFGWHVWQGETGERYKFKITLTRKGIPEGGGIYIFVRRRFGFFLFPLYVGKATELRSRLYGHERWWEAWWKRGATERHVLPVRNGTDRARIEEDLIRRYQPRMNDMLVPRGQLDAPSNAKLRRVWRWRQWWKNFLTAPFRGGRRPA